MKFSSGDALSVVEIMREVARTEILPSWRNLFADAASAKAYATRHRARLESFGIKRIRALFFDVNGPLSEITRGPVSPQTP